MRVDVFGRQGAFVGSIGSEAIVSAVHTDELNGEDSLDISTTYPLSAGYRLVWSDRAGTVHEHVCQDPAASRVGRVVLYSDTALSSICEMSGDRIDDKRPHGYSFTRALQAALEPTRWEVGTVDQPGTVSDGLTFYHTDARSSIRAILECGGELEAEIGTDGGAVSSRKVSIRAHRGRTDGHRRFTYGKDLVSIVRTEHWTPITACVGYGKGLETDSGGYGRKLTFEDVNGGLDYVADQEALELYGRPDGSGGLAHIWGTYENGDCEDAQQLLDETRAYLDAHSAPGVTYEADALDLVAMGRDWEGVGVGDDVQIVDTCFDPPLRCEGRVTKLATDMLAGTCTVTLGNVTETLADSWQQQQQQISDLQSHAPSWSVAADTPFAYLEQLIGRLNERFNVEGMSYTHTSFEHGTIWSSVPLDEDGRPTQPGALGVQICSQGIRIAGTTLEDGSFDWRTFGTGEGFVADLIVAGTLNAGLIKAGVLQVMKGDQVVFSADFESGDVTISSTVPVGDGTLGDSVTSSAIEFGLSDDEGTEPTSWSESTVWEHGKVLWQRTAQTHADGTVTHGEPSVVQTSEGTGVASQTDQYYLSTSDAEPTGGAWQDVQPAWVTGRHYWMRRKVAWTDGTVTYGDPYLARALTSANQSTDDLDESLDVEGVFNRLTNNGALQGIYLSGGQLYVNATYIRSGTLDADLLRTGRIQSKDGGSWWDLDSGQMQLDFAPEGMATTDYVDGEISGLDSSLSADISSVSGRVTTAQNRANSAYSLASTASSTASNAKAKTDRITFTTSGMTCQGTNGRTYTAMTYGSDGIVSANAFAGISTDQATMTIKNWGFYAGSLDGSVRMYVTKGAAAGGEGDPVFAARTTGVDFYVASDGVYLNNRKLAFE